MKIPAARSLANPTPAQPHRFGPHWYQKAWRRSTIDMHIPDWDPQFMAEFDVERFVDAFVRSRAQSVLVPAMSHTGLYNYPTKVGRQHGALHGRDVLGEMIDCCHRHGIAFEVYGSLVFDRWAYDEHPEWRGRDARGIEGFEFGAEARYGLVCPNSPYRDYVRAWVRELCERYDFEAIFFDMTYWPGVCYCDHCQRRWAKEAGGELPRIVNWTDPRWVAFQRKREKWLGEFAALATDTVRRFKPRAAVEHQSSTLPAPWLKGASHSLAVQSDFLSGDFYGGPLQGSFARKQLGELTRKRPFVFATSYSTTLLDHTGHKPEELLEAKVSAALADHSAFLFIDAINPIGTVHTAAHDCIGRVFDRLEPFYAELGGTRVADIAVYHSLDSKFDMRDNGRPVAELGETDTHTPSAMNVADRLITNHLPFTVITAQRLDELSRYKVLVLPNVHHLAPVEARAIRAFVRRGGGLYASGDTSVVTPRGRQLGEFQLADVFGVSLVQADWSGREHYVAPTAAGAADFIGWDAPYPPLTRGYGFTVKARPGAEVLATTTLPWPAPSRREFSSIHSNPPWVATEQPEVVFNRYGRGRVVYCASVLEDVEGLRETFVRLLRRLHPAYAFEADAPAAVELTLFAQPNRQRHLLSLVNFQRELPNLPVDGIEVRLRLPRRIRRIRQLPQGRVVPHRERDGVVSFKVPRLRTFAMFAVDGG
ncbi:MAG: beta-galactosidase trimerization domain-containing protein [Opitutales bacterium]